MSRSSITPPLYLEEEGRGLDEALDIPVDWVAEVYHHYETLEASPHHYIVERKLPCKLIRGLVLVAVLCYLSRGTHGYFWSQSVSTVPFRCIARGFDL